MTWPTILLLAAASYLLKAVGPLFVGARELPPRVGELLDIAAVPLLAALVLVQTVGTAGSFTIDARVPAVGWACVTAGRRRPINPGGTSCVESVGPSSPRRCC